MRVTGTCTTCGGAGWLWWHELTRDYHGPGRDCGSDDTRYLCDACCRDDDDDTENWDVPIQLIDDPESPSFDRVLIPVSILHTLIDAASRIYPPAFCGSQSAIEMAVQAARAADNILVRHAEGLDNGPMARVGKALTQLRRERVLTQADSDMVYERIRAAMME